MRHITYNNIAWHVPTPSRDELDLDDAPADDEPGRKFLVEGEGGFYMQAVRIPPDFTAPDHHHDHAEIFMVVDGSCTFNGQQMGPLDTAVVEAGEPYGFVSGPTGVQFVVTRQEIARFVEEAVEDAAEEVADDRKQEV